MNFDLQVTYCEEMTWYFQILVVIAGNTELVQ